MRNFSFISTHYGTVQTCGREAAHSILTFLTSIFLTVPSFAQNHVSYTYDSAGNRDSRTWTTGSVMARHGSDSLFPVQIPITPDTLSIKSVRTKVSLDPNNLPLALSEDEKSWLNDEFFKSQMAEEEAWWKEYEKRPKLRAVNTTYSVGAIPLQEGVSPTGARTYSLTIPTASGFKLVPNVSLAYNSQASEGWAGYGWDIQGISCIKLINKNEYYHGEIKAADVTASDPVFALDGVPLVTNEHSATSSEYPLETARGHILAATETNSYGRVTKFTVLYPNGVRAVYGRSHSYNYNLVFYKLSEMTDLLGNKITFSYTIDAASGNDSITSIRYGFDSEDNYSGEISFTYTSWTDSPIRYFAGKTIRYTRRLTSIESRSDSEVLATYNFSYLQSGPLWLMDQIDCTSESASLPPVQLTYPEIPASEYLRKDSQSITLDQSFFVYGVDNVYKRGKFVSGEYRDGILIHPGLLPYDILGGSPSMGYYYGSRFNVNQKIIFIPRLESSNVVNTTLECGNGFQSIDAVDVDGDGVDEIVRLNTSASSATGDNTQLTITIYRPNDQGAPVQERSFEVLLKGVVGTRYRSTYNRDLRWGDFNGDGKADLLAVAYKKNVGDSVPSYTQVCYTAVVDISSQSVLSDEQLFDDYFITEEKRLIVCDIDNDGRTELCFAEENGLKIFRLQSSGHFSLEKTVPGITSSMLTSSERPCYFADINGDGYLDIARTPSTSSLPLWIIYYYNGNNFSGRAVNIATTSSFSDALFMDINRDGMTDFVSLKTTSDSTATLRSYINTNGYTFDSAHISPSNISDAKGIVPVNVSAYNQPSAFMKFDGLTVYNYSYQGFTVSSRHITRVKDSYGKVHSSGYAYLPARSSSWSDASLTVNTSQGYKFYTLPISVLSLENHYMSESMASSYSSLTYEYYNGVVHNWGLGFCGFSRIRTKEMASPTTFYVNDYTDTYFLPEKMGVVSKVERRKGPNASNLPYYTLNNTWDSHSTTYGKLNPHLTQSMAYDALTGIRTQTKYIYDSWDYATESQTSHLLSGASTQYERQTWTYQHNASSARYVLGSITGESITQDLDGDSEYQWKAKTIITLDTLFRPVSTKYYKGKCYCPSANPFFEASDSTRLTGETKWTYDSYGNVLTEKSTPYNATEFIGHTYTYDSNGRYCLTDTDALGHTTTYVNYNKFGKPFRVVDYRNRSTYYSYDAFGRITTVRRIDSSIEATAYAWGGEGAYTVTKTDVSSGASTVTHYDALDREVRRGSKRFDGQWQYTDTKYNRNGQVSQSSLPFKGSTPTYWSTYTYDTYHRPTKITEASGKETTWSYSGTSVTTVKDGITSVSTKDASGNVVSVQDAGGTITYTLRDDGQPSKITAPGNVETIFAYDNYGRRTSINDPSAGTRTEAYVWNSDGSHQQTHTGPNGSITTSWDKYGRTTSVVRPGEFNTTYTYNTYGLLSNEQSTNGTGTEYTYDSYDRIATVKETVPDSKWLKKTYTYGSWGNVSTIKYTTQSGDITTETYSYANGNNTGVSITGGTTVWSLVEENALGLPTEITTGSVTREYGFTDFGLPTYRKMGGGNLQSFTYNFNVNTGNLTSRTDVVNNKTESFGYDGLNRLRAMNGRIIGLDNNGNITSMGGVGTIDYGITDKPYQVTSLTPSSTSLVPDRQQEISYNSLDRPSVLTEGYKTATFTYNAAGDRVKMQESNSGYTALTRYYIGGQYEYDSTPAGIKERLYLGGDAYSAPMVLQKVNGGSWTAYNIGRDYLGSITHIATSSGTLVAEYSYDPWGRLRNPATQAIYTPGTEPALFLGRGYTGHEHLTWFGLINMNARLYDPLLGRFLSPDPNVQAPDFSQNFNRYTYALNNPLKYTDKKGQAFEGSIFTFLLQLPVAIFGGVIMPFFIGMYDPAAAGDWASEIWTDFGERVWNAIKIDAGQFAWNSDWDPGLNICSIFLRNTWERPQLDLGRVISHFRNNLDDVTVDYYKGATVIKGTEDSGAMTLGSYINGGPNLSEELLDDSMLEHEYGHTFQSRILGPFYLPVVGIPSFMGSGVYYMSNGSHQHRNEWYEVWSNQLSYTYHKDRGYPDVADKLSKSYPIEQNPDWYFTATCVYYGALLAVAAILLL